MRIFFGVPGYLVLTLQPIADGLFHQLWVNKEEEVPALGQERPL